MKALDKIILAISTLLVTAPLVIPAYAQAQGNISIQKTLPVDALTSVSPSSNNRGNLDTSIEVVNKVASQGMALTICKAPKNTMRISVDVPQTDRLTLQILDSANHRTSNVHMNNVMAGTYLLNVDGRAIRPGLYHVVLRCDGKTLTSDMDVKSE